MSFTDFFQTSTGHLAYSYQCRLAWGPDADPDRPDTLCSGTTCHSQVLPPLDRYGLFRLAVFEAVFRAADICASILAKTASGGESHA